MGGEDTLTKVDLRLHARAATPAEGITFEVIDKPSYAAEQGSWIEKCCHLHIMCYKISRPVMVLLMHVFSNLLVLLVSFGGRLSRGRLRVGVASSGPLLVDLLEEAKRGLLSLTTRPRKISQFPVYSDLAGRTQSAHLIVLLLQSLRGDIIAPQTGSSHLTELCNQFLHSLLLGRIQLRLELLQVLLDLLGEAFGLVGLLDDSLLGLVGLGELFTLLNHSLNLGVRKTRARSDSHGLLLVRGLVDSRDVNDTISVCKV